MAKTPYLNRRGNNLFFRIVVPAELRPLTGQREITKTLRTQKYSDAVPIALRLAGVVKDVFNRLRFVTDKNEIDALIAIMQLDASDEERHAQLKLAIEREIALNKGMSIEQLIRQHRLKHRLHEQQDNHISTLASQRSAHLTELQTQQSKYDDVNTIKDKIIKDLSTTSTLTPAPTPSLSPTPDSSVMLSEAIESYIAHYATLGKREMLEKIKSTVKVLFLEITGDKPITKLSKRDLTNFFNEVQKLPSTWKSDHQKGMTVKDIITKNEGKPGLSENTIKTPYKAALAGFLGWSYSQLFEDGFPPLQITKHDITYRGVKRTGDGNQRNFKPSELQRIFEAPEMKYFATTKAELHKYWLLHIGLFTGARINEICQLNPQEDIYEANGVWCFKFTEDTEADEDVVKSIKKTTTRLCPIHSKLIELGFLNYVAFLREQKVKRMFPAWRVISGNAAAKAGQWFSEHLIKLGLRDETIGKRIAGFHAFRHTFITHAENHDIPKYFAISGHVDKNVPDSARAYIHGKDEIKLREIIEAFDFGLNFHKPVSPE